MNDSESGFDAASYGRGIADLYDMLYPPTPDCDRVASALAATHPGGTVLELGIGTGRMGLALARQGLKVHGLEISEDMIRQLLKNQESADIVVHQGDMSSFDLGIEFDAITCFSDGLFALPSQAQQTAAMRCSAAHLNPDGRLYIETTWPGVIPHRENGEPIGARNSDDSHFMVTTSYRRHLSQECVYAHSIIGPQGIRVVNEFFRFAWPSELDLMALNSGLKLIHRWSDWGGGPVPPEPGRLVSVFALDQTSAR
ncbi:class I SAM-dependent methyltransferase [Nocardia mexicana]|nr:class I SAM-dependent methyltransferase [Nocardia mexicana]